MSIKEIKHELQSHDVDASNFVEKEELINALQEARSKTEAAAITQDDTDTDPIASAPQSQDQTSVPLQHLISEISIDTTPKKSMVAKILGGEFTFLGQYESEGVVVMVRRPDWNGDDDEEEEEMPPINPHQLQPPLDEFQVRGDVLLMRVAETREELDDEEHDNNDDDNENEVQIHVPSSEEFFLDYTKEEYLKFAARTDVVWEEPEGDDEEMSEEEDQEDEIICKTNGLNGGAHDSEDRDDPNYDPEAASSSDEEYDSEEHQIGMMNLILGQILRKFHEEHGRGPNTLELLDMRKALADRLGVEVPEVDEEACDWDRKVETPKRHNKKVVVDEERNECDIIECEGGQEHVQDGEQQDEEEEGSLKQPANAVENGAEAKDDKQTSEAAEVETESRELKRPVDAVENGEAESNEPVGKKAKLDGETNASEDS
jgi:hypothetical protein